MSFFSKYPTDVTVERMFSITPDEIQLLNPNTGNCPAFITRADADLTIGVYRRHPIFIRDGSPVVTLGRQLHGDVPHGER